jgi:hypothetical protein
LASPAKIGSPPLNLGISPDAARGDPSYGQTDRFIEANPQEDAMKSHRRRRSRHAAALAVAACAALAAPAAALPLDNQPQPASASVGDTPADFAQSVAPAPRSGDTPADHPGASRAPQFEAPARIQVVRPERTILRDGNEALPVVLSSAALLVAVGGSAFLLVGSIRRKRLGASH